MTGQTANSTGVVQMDLVDPMASSTTGIRMDTRNLEAPIQGNHITRPDGTEAAGAEQGTRVAGATPNAEPGHSFTSEDPKSCDNWQLRLKLKELELEEKRIALEEKRLEMELRMLEVRQSQEVNSEDEHSVHGDSDLVKFSNVLKATLPKVPDDPADLPDYFNCVEKVFGTYGIPEQHQGMLLLPFLGSKTQTLLSRLDADELNSYEKIKEVILEVAQLTPSEYKKRFDSIKKQPSETWSHCCARVKSLLHYYVKSRRVDTIEGLLELMAADKIRDLLPSDTKNYVQLQEGLGWETALNIALFAERFEEASCKENNEKKNFQVKGKVQNKYANNNKYKWKPSNPKNQNGRKRCFICDDVNHLANACPKRPTARSQIVQVESENTEEKVLTAKISIDLLEVRKELQPLETIPVGCDDVTINAVIDSGTQICVVREDLVPLKYMEDHGIIFLTPAIGPKSKAKLIKLPLFLKENYIGESQAPIDVLCAVTPRLNSEMLITPQAAIELNVGERDRKVGVGSDISFSERHVLQITSETSVLDSSNKEEQSCEKEIITFSGTESSDNYDDTGVKSDFDLFKEQQENCETLNTWWLLGKQNKGNFVIRNELLYHVDRVLGEKVFQLVLPLCRREKVLELAHSSVFGAHLGIRKTAERIRYTFNWPNLKKDVQNFCNACKACQLRAPKTVRDRVKIVPIVRPQYPFTQIFVDLIGPIEPPSARGNKYVLCAVDLHSRWPEAIPLRNLKANVTCDSLLEIFMRTGIPKIVVRDCGTNFTSQLTQEFLVRIGASPRFTSPGHPEANGLCERWNGVLKSMLHHVIREHPKQWDKYLPYLLWAYREVPNATTGVSPYTLLYGRAPTGPLSILKSHWTDERKAPYELTKPTEDYLKELKLRLEIAAEKAGIMSEMQQRAYAHNYNLRARNKNFNVGEQVLLLIPSDTNKLLTTWTGPGTIIEKRSNHSYLVKLDDGKVKLVHVNKIRPFVVKTSAMGVVFEDDKDFGDVLAISSDKLEPETKISFIDESKLNDLTSDQQTELKAVLDHFKIFFSGKVGRVNIEQHEIKLKPNATFKRIHQYKVPETLKSQVTKQIKDLLEKGMIEPTRAERVFPIVCVCKKDGTLRICVDYTVLNKNTVGDAFPMENSADMIRLIAKANFISTIDLIRGYWQINMAEDSKELTAFSTPIGNFVWRVMPFGLKNSAASFQRTINIALQDHRQYSIAYIDDVAVFSESWTEHLHHLSEVIKALEKIGFTANPQKCVFARRKVLFLGHVIGSKEINPDPEKIEVVRRMQPPSTKKEVRSVLGFFGYYRDHIQNFADLAYPLTKLTSRKVNSKIPWGDEEQRAFDSLKSILCTAPTLYTPDFNSPFILDADASGVAVGACISQINANGIEHPIAFASKKFSETQARWSTIEKEAYAVIWAIKKFEHWIFGSKIIVRSDHNPLSYLTETYPQSPKLQRWALALQKYDIDLKHRPGKKNVNADVLSRLPGY